MTANRKEDSFNATTTETTDHALRPLGYITHRVFLHGGRLRRRAYGQRIVDGERGNVSWRVSYTGVKSTTAKTDKR